MPRSRRPLMAIAAAVAIALSSPTTVSAQVSDPGAHGDIDEPPVKDPAAARRWLAAAQLLMRRGSYFAAKNRPDDAKPQFENAVAAYRKALAAGDDINVYLELAIAEDRAGRPDEAVRHLRTLVNASDDVRPGVRKKASTKLEELSAKVGVVTLAVSPVGTSITIGGSELGTSPLREALVLLPGTYTLAFQADGFEAEEAEIKIEAGSETRRAIELAPIPAVPAPAAPVAPRPPIVREPPLAPPRPPGRLALYTGGGATAAAAIGAAVLGVLAIRQHTVFAAASTTSVDREDARANGRRLALAADISLGTALVAAGFTVWWYRYKYQPALEKSQAQHSPRGAAKLGVAPWVQSQSGGVTIAGRF